MTHCCGGKSNVEEQHQSKSSADDSADEKDKAGIKEYLIAGLLIALIVFAAVTALKINAFNAGGGGGGSQQAQGQETYEQMMARMHPEQAASSGNTMVGGC